MIDPDGFTWRRFERMLGSRLPSADAANVGSQAGDADNNPSVLFQPVADAVDALTAFQRGSDLRPERTDLCGLSIGFLTPPSRQAKPGFRSPVPAAFEIVCRGQEKDPLHSRDWGEVRGTSTRDEIVGFQTFATICDSSRRITADEGARDVLRQFATNCVSHRQPGPPLAVQNRVMEHKGNGHILRVPRSLRAA
jgi:hypothetical protein